MQLPATKTSGEHMGRKSNDSSAHTSNARASERVQIGVPAGLKWGDRSQTGIIEVVNLGGMYIATTRCPELGDYVDCLFSLPGDRRSFRVRGSVVFLDPDPATTEHPPGFGARFERPPVALLEAIKAISSKKEH
ncbi:MAG: PilZ domain-containing protein [Thermoanaerobaculia bacterium]